MKDYYDFESKERIRINLYLESIFKYGYITLCYLLSQYEKDEEYRECELILHALQHHQLCYSHKHPTKYNDEAKAELRKELQEFGFSGDTIIQNIPIYAAEIKKHVRYYTENLK